MTDTTAPARRKPWPVILLALLFIGPLAAAWIVYYAVPDWRPSGQANYGELIDPPISLPDLVLAGPDGEPLGDAPLRQRWTLIYVDDSGCGESCRQTLFDTYQVRYLLHRDLDRVRRILLYTGAPPDPALVAEQHRTCWSRTRAKRAHRPLSTPCRHQPPPATASTWWTRWAT